MDAAACRSLRFRSCSIVEYFSLETCLCPLSMNAAADRLPHISPGLHCALRSNPALGQVAASTNLVPFPCESRQQSYSETSTFAPEKVRQNCPLPAFPANTCKNNTHNQWIIANRRRMTLDRPSLAIASADWLPGVGIHGGDSRKPWSTCSSNSAISNPEVVEVFFCRSLLSAPTTARLSASVTGCARIGAVPSVLDSTLSALRAARTNMFCRQCVEVYNNSRGKTPTRRPHPPGIDVTPRH